MTTGSGPALRLAALLDEPRERGHRFRADVVLDALGVAARGVGVDAEREQEGPDHLVAFAAGLGEGLAFRGQECAAVWLLHDKAGLHQALEHLGHGRLGDAQARGDVDLAGLAAVAHQVRDQFDVVLDQLEAMRLAHLAEAFGVQVGVDQRRRGWLGLGHAGSRPVARTRAAPEWAARHARLPQPGWRLLRKLARAITAHPPPGWRPPRGPRSRSPATRH